MIIVDRSMASLGNDPSAVPANEVWWVRLPDGDECAGQRHDSAGPFTWYTAGEGGYRDADVTLLHRLTPELGRTFVEDLIRSRDEAYTVGRWLVAEARWEREQAQLWGREQLRLAASEARLERLVAEARWQRDRVMPECALPAPDSQCPEHLRFAADILDDMPEEYNADSMRWYAGRLESERAETFRRDKLIQETLDVLKDMPGVDSRSANLVARAAVAALLAADGESDGGDQ